MTTDLSDLAKQSDVAELATQQDLSGLATADALTAVDGKLANLASSAEAELTVVATDVTNLSATAANLATSTALGVIDSGITRLENTASSLSSQSAVDALQTEITALKSSLDNMRSSIGVPVDSRTGQANVTTRLSDLERDRTNVTSALAGDHGLTKTAADIDGRLTHVETKTDKLAKGLSNVNDTVSRLGTTTNATSTALDVVSENVKAILQKASIDDDIASIRTAIGGTFQLDGGTGDATMINRLASLDIRCGALEASVSGSDGLTPKVNDISRKVDTFVNRFDAIDEVLSSHQNTLTKLETAADSSVTGIALDSRLAKFQKQVMSTLENNQKQIEKNHKQVMDKLGDFFTKSNDDNIARHQALMRRVHENDTRLNELMLQARTAPSLEQFNKVNSTLKSAINAFQKVADIHDGLPYLPSEDETRSCTGKGQVNVKGT